MATYVATVVPGAPVPTTPPPTTPPPTAPGAGTPVTRPVVPPLAHTGTDLGPLLSAATGLLLLGAALTRLPHRRRRR